MLGRALARPACSRLTKQPPWASEQVPPPLRVQDAVFAAQLGRLARGVALADVRERVHALQGELEAALEREVPIAAAGAVEL